MRHLFKFLLLTGIIGFCASVALADTGAGTDSPQSLAALWPMLGVSLASLAAYGIRKLSAEYTFFHTGAGAFVLALIGSVISTVTPVIQAHGFAWAALAWAAVGGLTSFVATLNPSTTADQPPAKSPAAKSLPVILPLAFGALFLSGCELAPGTHPMLALGAISGGLLLAFVLSRVLSTPRLYKAGVLIPMVLVGCLSISGCQTTGGQALGKCELGSLPATLESVIAEVIAVAMNPASVVTDLEALGGKVGPGQLSCAVQAVEAWLSGSSAATSSRLMAGVGESQRQHGLELLHTYLNGHPTACSNRIAL